MYSHNFVIFFYHHIKSVSDLEDKQVAREEVSKLQLPRLNFVCDKHFLKFGYTPLVKMTEAQKPGYSKTFTLVCLMANIALSISIVLVNKSVYEFYHFPNMTLTCLHFVCTFVGMCICRAMGMFQPKALPLLKMAPIAVTFCGFVVFTNLSLQYNTVGTYQIIKSMTTPCIIILQTYFYQREFSTKVKFTLVSNANYSNHSHVCMCVSLC